MQGESDVGEEGEWLLNAKRSCVAREDLAATHEVARSNCTGGSLSCRNDMRSQRDEE